MAEEKKEGDIEAPVEEIPAPKAVKREVSFDVVVVEDTQNDTPKPEQAQRGVSFDFSHAEGSHREYNTVSDLSDTVEKRMLDRRASVRNSIASIHSDLRQSMKDLSEPKEGKYIGQWSKERSRLTAWGCLSSCIVLTVRLLLDTEPTAYLIHSIIVFLDMVLIHLFTNNLWLSVSGELLTIIFFLSFHYTKETLFELLETTFIAILCSFHLIASRNKAKLKNEDLKEDMQRLRMQTLDIIENPDELTYLHEEFMAGNEVHLPTESLRTVFVSPSDPVCRHRLKVYGSHFFEYFLDGSAGVMYTSFLGLIIDEILRYGQDKDY